MDRNPTRREMLAALGGGAATALAGCGGFGQDSAGQPASTSGGSEGPTITDYRANPVENGTILEVSLAGADEDGLEEARIVYGDREIVRRVDDTSVAFADELQDAAVTSDDGRITYQLIDAAGNETRESLVPDGIAPELSVTAAPTTRAGELHVEVEGTDETGLRRIRLLLDGELVRDHDAIGTRAYAAEQVLVGDTVTALGQNALAARIEDWNGNTAEKEVAAYARRFDRMQDAPLDIGAVYISQQGGGFSQPCRDSYEGIEPAVGIYDADPIPTDVTTRHIDQMTGHGVTRLIYDYEGVEVDGDRGRVDALLDSPLIDQVAIQPMYGKMGPLWRRDENWKETVFPEDLTYLRDTFLERDTIATYNGRPVVSTWDFISFAWDGERDKIMDEFGSYETFVEDMRAHLRIDGTDPFLILGKGPVPLVDHGTVRPLVTQFDGVTTWLPANRLDVGTTPWPETLAGVERSFADTRQFAEAHGMEFTPQVFPGSDFRGAGCGREGDKHLPREPARFQQVFELAKEYSTGNRINIATWNDWTEGTQIEPGTFRGEDYDTAYLDVVEDVQREHP